MISDKQTIILFLVLITVISSILSCSRVFGNEGNSLNAQSDQTLYFQPTFSDLYGYDMNTTMPNGETPSFVMLFFVSPHLAQSFTFKTITTTIYHEEVLARGTYTLLVTSGFVDINGMQHSVRTDSETMTIGSTVTSVTTNFNTQLLEQERLYIQLSVYNTLLLGLQIYWGNSTYPSRVSYEGTAVFVPEFPSFLILPLFMIATLIAVVIYKKRIAKWG